MGPLAIAVDSVEEDTPYVGDHDPLRVHRPCDQDHAETPHDHTTRHLENLATYILTARVCQCGAICKSLISMLVLTTGRLPVCDATLLNHRDGQTTVDLEN